MIPYGGEVVPLYGIGILLGHLIGDYIFQTHHQALTKTSSWLHATVHACTYTLAYAGVFVLLDLTLSWQSALVIGGSHLLIDRWRLAKYVNYAKNMLAPAPYRPKSMTPTGYPEGTSESLALALLILTDNTIHLTINTFAIFYLTP